MTDKQLKDDVLRILQDQPPVRWDGIARSCTPSELGEMSRCLDSICETAARLSEYLSQRGGMGCGDQGHDTAVKEQNRTARRVRKALGYTIPGNDIRF